MKISRSIVSDSLGLKESQRILQARILEWVAAPFSRGYFQPRAQTQVSCSAGRFFTSWATRGATNTGVGSYSHLQGIFPTWESNQGLLHCRQRLYQLSYQWSPSATQQTLNKPPSSFPSFLPHQHHLSPSRPYRFSPWSNSWIFMWYSISFYQEA